MNVDFKKKLLLIFCAALVVRVVGLGFVPPGLNSDELLKAYDGACVYLTGKDHHGETLPLFFKQSGEYSPPLYTYFAGLFSAPFGINAYTVRLPAAFIGALTVLAAYYFGTQYKDKSCGILLAALTALSPWNLYFSRIGWEAISLVLVQLTALAVFFHW